MTQTGDASTGIYWIASYPKSGNTWVRLFLSALKPDSEIDLARMDNTGVLAISRSLIEQLVDLDLADLSWQEAAELRPVAYRALAEHSRGPVFLKTHDACGKTPSGADLFPIEATLGCIHIVRDPRDVCLSLAAHDALSVDRAIARLGEPDTPTDKTTKTRLMERRGSWSEHATSWLDSPLRRLTLRYEDLVANPMAAFTALTNFCGLVPSTQDIARAIAATDFERLAAQEAERGFRERPAGMERFFRAGRAGQWRDALSPHQLARIEQDHGIVMRRLGYALDTPSPASRSSRPSDHFKRG